jgi:hypothetical protein
MISVHYPSAADVLGGPLSPNPPIEIGLIVPDDLSIFGRP